jgi:hypothetical protein
MKWNFECQDEQSDYVQLGPTPRRNGFQALERAAQQPCRAYICRSRANDRSHALTRLRHLVRQKYLIRESCGAQNKPAGWTACAENELLIFARELTHLASLFVIGST